MGRRWMRTRATSFSLGVILALAMGGHAVAATAPRIALTADLDGVPINPDQVGKWYCDDFDYPAIHCFSKPILLETRATLYQLLAGVTFVTVYDFGSFSGSYMHMSQDYTALVTIGWSDRISSLRGRNGEQSHFYADWFYGGSSYYVCCNWQITSLGAFNNTFSSVHRN